jgi:peptide/nickel transport system substrate-binding protein
VADSIAQDQMRAVEDAGASVLEASVLGTSFLRMVNDVAPFDDPAVRQAMNHAVDVQSIGTLLVSEHARRLASLFPDERSIGFDPQLEPFTYDPDLARTLLTSAGYPDGFETVIEYTGGNDDVMQAIVANLADVGVRATLKLTELATFNGSWQADDSAPLRYVSWRPVYDPHTLLSLMFASTGPLSRYADPEADALIHQAATDVDPDGRAETYRNLGTYFQKSPPAVFLWNLTSIYGVRGPGLEWSPRGDEYILPMKRGE